MSDLENNLQRRISDMQSGHQREKDTITVEGKKIEAELQLKLKNKQRQLETLQSDMTASIENLKTQVIELNN